MTLYRIRHIPSGLYYQPNTYRSVERDGYKVYAKTNLTEGGKIYHKKPTLKWLKEPFGDRLLIYSHVHAKLNRVMETKESHWAIEEMK